MQQHWQVWFDLAATWVSQWLIDKAKQWSDLGGINILHKTLFPDVGITCIIDELWNCSKLIDNWKVQHCFSSHNKNMISFRNRGEGSLRITFLGLLSEIKSKAAKISFQSGYILKTASQKLWPDRAFTILSLGPIVTSNHFNWERIRYDVGWIFYAVFEHKGDSIVHSLSIFTGTF